jgi:reverse gyrase
MDIPGKQSDKVILMSIMRENDTMFIKTSKSFTYCYSRIVYDTNFIFIEDKDGKYTNTKNVFGLCGPQFEQFNSQQECIGFIHKLMKEERKRNLKNIIRKKVE